MSARRSSPGTRVAVALALVACLTGITPVGASSLPWTFDRYLLDFDLESDVGEPAGHLVVSEVMTGGASALDEFIELYNPTAEALPLEGLEVIYVTASGAGVSRRAEWSAGAPSVPPGGHVLVAHESGIFAPIADLLYGSGLAAAGGSVAIRIQGAGSAIDAVGWGTAGSSWMEGEPAAAPPPGSSLERLPGGSLGSGQDSDNNAVDFVVRPEPEPQNSGSSPVPGGPPSTSPLPSPIVSASPSPAPSPTSSATPIPTASPSPAPTASSSPTPSAAPSASPTPTALTISEARAQADGTSVTVVGVSVTDSAFGEGGGYLADAEAGIAILLSSGEFPRGARLLISGKVEDRYHQRTIRASASGIVVLGPGLEPPAVVAATGAVGEPHEGRLVRVSGTIQSGPTPLAAGLAYEVSDGSGPVRVIVGPGTGIDTSAWSRGVELEVVGVVGQRDSTGGGSAGYRIQVRDDGDLHALLVPGPSPAPSATPGPSSPPQPSPTGSPTTPLVTIATARSSTTGTLVRIRGVVTAPSGLVAPGSAVIQDASGAILLRHSDEVGPFARGELIEVEGTRATLSGMLSVRVTRPASRAGSQAEPDGLRLTSGALGEAHEARLVVVRGAISTTPRRSTANNVFFSIDDGTGPAAVAVFAASGIGVEGLVRGAWIEVQGVLGQETTGSLPDRGYRIWPRDNLDLRIIAAPTGSSTGMPAAYADGPLPATVPGAGTVSGVLGDMSFDGEQDLSVLLAGTDELVRATLVVGGWPELEMAGLLWDGERLVAIRLAGGAGEQVASALGAGRPPVTVEVRGRAAPGSTEALNIELMELDGPEAILRQEGRPAPPLPHMPSDGDVAWVRLAGTLEAGQLRVMRERIRLEVLCADQSRVPDLEGMAVMVEGIGLSGSSSRLVVPCGGMRPMPTLALATAPATPRPSSKSPPPREAVKPLVSVVDPSRPASGMTLLVAALLALAALVSVAARTGSLRRIVREARRLVAGAVAEETEPVAAVAGPAPAGGTLPSLALVPAVEEPRRTSSPPEGRFP